MSTNETPPTTTILAATGMLFGSQRHPDDDAGASDNNARHTVSKNSQIWQPTTQFHPPPGLVYTLLQGPFANDHQLYHTDPFNITPSSHPSSGATQAYLSYGPSWQAYAFPEEGNSGPEMFPPQKFTGDGPSSSSTLQVPPAPPVHNRGG